MDAAQHDQYTYLTSVAFPIMCGCMLCSVVCFPTLTKYFLDNEFMIVHIFYYYMELVMDSIQHMIY